MSTLPVLAQLRRDRHWTQADLAERSGVSRAEVSAIETGRHVPSVAVAMRLARGLGVSVEQAFGGRAEVPAPQWAWPAVPGDGRAWQASVGARVLLYPVEPTAAGSLPHDVWVDGRGLQGRHDTPDTPTLVMAGCDPLVGMLAPIMARQRIRVLPLLRSSAQALELLRQGLVHVAGVHVTDVDGRSRNDGLVRERLGAGYHLVHQVRWDAGVVVAPERRERSVAALVRARVRWVNREDGSAAREIFDTLLGSRRARPEGYDHVVRDHRAVATTVASGWAEAGVCVRPVAADARLSFLPLHREAYELCVPDALLDDARVVALLSALRSSSYRAQLGDVPGCDGTQAGEARVVA